MIWSNFLYDGLAIAVAVAITSMVGVGMGWWLKHCRVRAESWREERLRTTMIAVQEMVTGVADEVGKYAARLEEITHDLLKPNPGSARMDERVLLDSVSQIVLTNKKLLNRLVATEHLLSTEAGQINLQLSAVRTDALTGLPNRRAFDDALAGRFEEWNRSGAIFSVLLFEIDLEHWSHAVGTTDAANDLVQRAAHALAGTMRDMDQIARVSADRFAILLPMTALHDATRAAERLLANIGRQGVLKGDQSIAPLSFVGVAEIASNDNLRSLPRRADTALGVAREACMPGGYFHDGQTCHPIVPQSALPSRGDDSGEAKLTARTQHYAQYVAALNVDARTDVLTGLPNRRAFSDELRRRVQEARQSGQPLSLLVVGVDNLARIGSLHGQEAIDQVMRKVAQIICAAVRDSDMVTRYGWEEFTVILPGISTVEASHASRRLLSALGCCVVELEEIEVVTVTSGIAELDAQEDANSLARRADETLRSARLSGENTARFSSPTPPAPLVNLGTLGGDPAAVNTTAPVA
ncbi:MAG: diguanylate cyclase [Planctomycetes bacterium]|nr:diguanylate cyclase [Planctomycetota bacterium]